VNLNELEALTDAATPGPWTATNWGGYDPQDDQWYVDFPDNNAAIYVEYENGICVPNTWSMQEQNMKFIAAANPQTVKQLIGLVRQCKDALVLATLVVEGEYGCDDALAIQCNAAIEAFEALDRGEG
jgi:hypothetical protein